MVQSDPVSSLKQEAYSLARALETKRVIFMLWLLVGIGVASFAMTFLLLYLHPHGIDLRYTVTFGALAPSAIMYAILSNIYMEKAQRDFIYGLCEAAGFQYRDDGCFAVSSAERHKILPEHNKSRLETGLQGTYKGTPIAIQEVILTALKQDPDHKNKQKEYLRFWGLLVRIQLSRRTEGHTVAVPPAAMKVFFRNDFSQYQKIKMPEGAFAQRYDVVATDGVEAKFVLNAGFKDSFMNAGKVLKAYWCEASFRETEILLAFQLFRPLVRIDPLWKPVAADRIRKIADELGSLIKIIDALKANPQVSL